MSSAHEYVVGGRSPLTLLPMRAWCLVESINGELLVEGRASSAARGGSARTEGGTRTRRKGGESEPRRVAARRYERGGRFASAFFVGGESRMTEEELASRRRRGRRGKPLRSDGESARRVRPQVLVLSYENNSSLVSTCVIDIVCVNEDAKRYREASRLDDPRVRRIGGLTMRRRWTPPPRAGSTPGSDVSLGSRLISMLRPSPLRLGGERKGGGSTERTPTRAADRTPCGHRCGTVFEVVADGTGPRTPLHDQLRRLPCSQI